MIQPRYLDHYLERLKAQDVYIKHNDKHACIAALISNVNIAFILCTVVQNTEGSNHHVPPIPSFALSFCTQLPQDWKPETARAESLMGLMESLLMEAHGALRLPPSRWVLQHR